jgi:DNA-binding transcriptional MerR regulator
VADYYNSQQLAHLLEIEVDAITQLEKKGLLQATEKEGRSFYSSPQAHRLRAAIRWARKDRIDLQEAFAKVEERWLAQTSAQKD